MRRVTSLVVGMVVALASCGSSDETSLSDPLAVAFADQLTIDAGHPWFQEMDSADTECFVTTVLDTVGPDRLGELRFEPDNIPLLFEADWTDSEIDALTEGLASCIDNETGTQIYVSSLVGGQDRYNDCMIPEVTSRWGDQYWQEQFRYQFNPPRTEMIRNEAGRQAQETGERPALEGSTANIDALFVRCIPDYPGEYAQDACGGEPCEDTPDSGDFHSIALECSRDPYFDASFYASTEELDVTLDFIFNCEEQGRGQLISARLEGYPCPEGPRDLEIPAVTGSITRQDIADACTTTI